MAVVKKTSTRGTAATGDRSRGAVPEALLDEVIAALVYAVSVSSAGKRVAWNPSSPVGVLEVLARDKDAKVRHGVAKNPSTPVAVLEVLAGDEKASVRRGVAGNQHTAPEVLAALSLDAEVTVRRAVHGNKAAGDEIRAQATLLGV